jgi:hypothetical protein
VWPPLSPSVRELTPQPPGDGFYLPVEKCRTVSRLSNPVAKCRKRSQRLCKERVSENAGLRHERGGARICRTGIETADARNAVWGLSRVGADPKMLTDC